MSAKERIVTNSKVPSSAKKSGAKVSKPKSRLSKEERPIKSDQAMVYTLDAAVKKFRDRAPDAPNGGKRKA